MTVVNPKSISGINSITTGSGSDNLLTIHTSDANNTERLRVNSSGDVIVGSGVTLSPDGDAFFTGVTTATTFVGALTGNVTGNISGGTVAGSTGTFSGDVLIADKIVHSGDTDTAIRFPTTNYVSIEAGGVEKVEFRPAEVTFNDTGIDCDFRIESDSQTHMFFVDGENDRIGIKADTPTGTLSIASGTFQTTTPTSTGDDLVISGNQSLGMQFLTLASGTSNNNIYFGDTDDPDIGMIRYAHADNSMQFQTNTEVRLRITSAGNIGINQSSPDQKLHISGTNDAIIRLESTDTGLGQDELVGALEFEKQDASGAGAGVCGGVRCYSEDTYGARTYLSFAVRSNSTGQAATDTEICRITRHGLIFDTSVTGTDSAKALDNYEEGTWIPSYGSSSVPTSTYATTGGRYTRVGRLVTVTGRIQMTNSTTNSGALTMGGFPFAASNHNFPGGITFSYTDNWYGSGSQDSSEVTFLLVANTQYGYFYNGDGNTIGASSTNDNARRTLHFFGSYETDA